MSGILVKITEMSGKIAHFFLKIASIEFWYHSLSTLCQLFMLPIAEFCLLVFFTF